MKKILILSTFLFTLLSIQASDDLATLFHERMEQLYTNVDFDSFTLLSNESIPQDILQLRSQSLDNLNLFAQSYDLFDLGWSYEISPQVYEITNTNGRITFYTFSIVISKNEEGRIRRFYQATRRVDGKFFIERIVNYDLN